MVERYWEALKGVMDPEIPILSVVEMGMVRGLEVEGGKVKVRFRPTFSGCPALKVIQEEIQRALKGVGAREVEVVTDLAPWSTEELSQEARAKLQAFGIAPPLPLSGDAPSLEPPPLCPRCGGQDVLLRNPFGPALCKALYQCRSCGEVFEAFKAI